MAVAFAAVVFTTTAANTTVAGAAPPRGACDSPAPASPTVTEVPWAQRTLDVQAVHRHGTGAGVVVAVVDSGVDADHPQLRQPGKVLRGQDFFLVGDLPGSFDCVSHGTAVAGIIAAEPVEGVGFTGLAPDATVLPVRVSDSDTSDGAKQAIDPKVLARGIRYATDHGADVINLSVAGGLDDESVRAAVRHAVVNDVVVVAAVGNAQQGTTAGPATFPAGYDGVLGVGAVDMSGTRLPSSQIGPQVDLVAPGGDVLSTARVGGHQYREGTSFAAPFVSATAALVRSAHPELSAEEIAERILATASPAPGGQNSPAYGAGLVNPYRALTEGLSDSAPAALPPAQRAAPDPAAVSLSAWWEGSIEHARTLLVLVAVGVLAGAALAVVRVRGRRNRWQPRRTVLPPARPVGDDLPEEMFLVPRPPVEH
nr:type VII secretion-associated serine protease mycosin [Saccharomonospora cyanea]